MSIHKGKISQLKMVTPLLQQIMARAEGTPVNGALATCLEAAVPLWILRIKDRQPGRNGKPDAGDYEWMRQLNDPKLGDDFCLRLEYVLFRGPKKGDTARAFNELARCISIMAFCPGGITVFGRRWEA